MSVLLGVETRHSCKAGESTYSIFLSLPPSLSQAGFSVLWKERVTEVVAFFFLTSTFCRRRPLAMCA